MERNRAGRTTSVERPTYDLTRGGARPERNQAVNCWRCTDLHAHLEGCECVPWLWASFVQGKLRLQRLPEFRAAVAKPLGGDAIGDRWRRDREKIENGPARYRRLQQLPPLAGSKRPKS